MPVKCSVLHLAESKSFLLMEIMIAVIMIIPLLGLSFLRVGLLDFPGYSQLQHPLTHWLSSCFRFLLDFYD